jgi:hypothetical protein
MQRGITLLILLNTLFDFIINRVIDGTGAIGVQLSYRCNDFFQGKSEKYEMYDLLLVLYVDKLMVLGESADEVQRLIRTSVRLIQEYGLMMSMKKMNTINPHYFEEGQSGKTIWNQTVTHSDMDITIQNQMIAAADTFSYLGCNFSDNQPSDEEIGTLLGKAAVTFNMLSYIDLIAKINLNRRKMTYCPSICTPCSTPWKWNMIYYNVLRTLNPQLPNEMSNHSH